MYVCVSSFKLTVISHTVSNYSRYCIAITGLCHYSQVVEIMSSAICDMVEGTFSKLRFNKEQTIEKPHIAHTNTTSNSPISHGIPPISNSRLYQGDIDAVLASQIDLNGTDLVDDIEAVDGVGKVMKTQFSVLLAKSCRCSAILGGYNHAVQDLASDFGMHLSLAEHVSTTRSHAQL